MHFLTEKQYKKEAERYLRQIFVNDDALKQPFSDNITERRIIYYSKYGIEPPLTDALILAANSVGDRGFYWSVLWRDRSINQKIDEINHCYISFSEFVSVYVEQKHELFQNIQHFFILENVIYSPQGKWGMMFHHEGFCLLGGTCEFVKNFENFIPNLEQQVYDFINYFCSLKLRYPDTVTIDWLPILLIHVYGQEKAKKMLETKRKVFE